MSNLNRREFLQSSMMAAAAASLPASLAVAAPTRRAGANDVLRIAVVGVKGRGLAHVGEWAAMKDVQVAALCDINKQNLAIARKDVTRAYGRDEIKEYHDFRELNADASIDAVLMVLPFHWHSIAALGAISHGKHIYHEKPIALSFAVGIVASLLRPEPESAAKFAEVSRRMHLGPTGSDIDAS